LCDCIENALARYPESNTPGLIFVGHAIRADVNHNPAFLRTASRVH
jgi:hypothetical protein